MILLEFNEKNYKLPTSFKEVNIEKYSKIISIDKELKDIDKYVKIISILTELEEEIVRTISLEQIKLIQNNIQFMFQTNRVDIVDRFELEGQKYGFNYELDKISFGEYIDLEEFSKHAEVNENLHIILAILYRPIKTYTKRNIFSIFKKNKIEDYKVIDYDSENVMKRAELFKMKLTMDKVLGSMVFFSILKLATILNSQGYSGKKLKMKVMEQLDLVKLEQLNQVG